MSQRRPSPASMGRIARLLGAAALVVSCGRDGPVGPTPVRIPAKVIVLSGDAQHGTVNQPLADPIVARVTDAEGLPVEGQIVNFRVVSGGGEVYAGAALTDENGIASERWTLGTLTSVAQRVEARAVSPAGDRLVFATFTAIPEPDAPDTLAIVSGNGQAGSLGATLANPLVVYAADQFGNPVPDASVSWTVETGGGSVTPATSSTDGNARAQTSWTLGSEVPGQQSVRATAGRGTALFTAEATGSPSSATLSITSGNNQTATVGNPFPQMLSVTVRDAQGQPLPSATVEWRVTSAAGTGGFVRPGQTFPDQNFTSTTSTSNSNGVATINAGAGKVAGAIAISATAGASTAAFSLTGQPGYGCKWGVTVQPTSSPVGTSVTVTVRRLDLWDNVSSRMHGQLGAHELRTSNGTITPVNVTVPVSTYNWTLPMTAGTATANWNHYSCFGSNAETVTSGFTGMAASVVTVTDAPAPASFVISGGNNQNGQVVTALANPLVVRATDANGNGVYGAKVTWNVGTNNGSVSPASSFTDANGYAQTSWTLGPTAGTRTLTATSPNAPTLTFTANAAPGAPALFDKTGGDNQTGTPNTALPVPLTVRVRDAHGNPIVGKSVTFTVTSGGGSVSPAGGVTGSDGQLATTWTLGDGTTANEVTASASGLTSVTFTAATSTAPALTFGSLAVGSSHACAIASDGRTFCWGSNQFGQMGDGTTQSPKPLPYATPTGYAFTSLAGGPSRECGFTATESYCWGYGGQGALGDGGGVNRTRPSALGNGPYREVAMGGAFMCGIVSNSWNRDLVRCGGTNHGYGELGDGTTGSHYTPELITGGRRFRRIAAANETVCGIAADGVTYCWGFGGTGARGDGTFDNAGLSPAPVIGSLAFTQIVGGSNFMCALDDAGAAWCWGENTSGQLGDGSTTNRNVPTAVAGGLTFSSITAGFAHACGVVANSGAVYCWGLNSKGQLGNNTNTQSSLPVQVSSGASFSSVSSNNASWSTCGTTTSGEVFCWGYNERGQLGDGTTIDRKSPVRALTP